jgi:hypothetical protein
VPLILHICGKTEDREFIAQTGMAAFHYDSKNDPVNPCASCATGLRSSAILTTPKLCSRKAPKRSQGSCQKPGSWCSAGGAPSARSAADGDREPQRNSESGEEWHKERHRRTETMLGFRSPR